MAKNVVIFSDGTGQGARAGILIRNAEALELLSRVDTIVVDKTGTLTEGRPEVTAIEGTAGWSDSELLRLAAAVERGSAHPLASAILRAAEARAVSVPPAVGFVSVAGKGVSAQVEGRRVDLGNAELLKTRGNHCLHSWRN